MKIFPVSIFLSTLVCCLMSLQAQEKKASPAPAGVAPTKAEFQAAGDRLLSKLEEFATVLDTAKTKTTAETAKPKLGKINQELVALSKAAQALGEPPPALKAELDSDPKMQQRAQVFVQKYTAASQRIAADSALLTVLQPSLKEFQKATQPPSKLEK